MAGQECGKDQAELRYGGTIAFPSEHKTKLVRNRSVPFRSVPFPSEHGLNANDRSKNSHLMPVCRGRDIGHVY